MNEDEEQWTKDEERWARDDLRYNIPEWYQPIYNGFGSCPWCENFKHEGHTEDCKRKLIVEIVEAALSE